jgi:hypothetical protein
MSARSKFPARRRAVIAALLVLSFTLVGAATASARTPRDFFGVMPQTSLSTQDIEHMGEAKVGTLRFEISWSAVDPTAGGDYNFGGVDAIVRDAAESRIRALPFIFATPGWVAKLDGANCPADRCGTFAPRSPAALAAFKAFTGDLVRRYGPDGVFWQQNPTLPKVPIRAWQIWNEQNSPSFYEPKPSVPRFAKMLKAAHDGISGADPGAETIVGGMFRSPLGGRKPGIFAEKFLAELYDIKGAKRSFEGVAIHPYAAKVGKVSAQVDLMRDAITHAHDRGTDIWITELGWASSGANNPLVRGSKGQAERLREAFNYFIDKRRAFGVRSVIWYSWQDRAAVEGLCAWCPGSGLLTKGGKEKPAYRAFVRYTGGS